jgi:hypothetical protein
MERDPPSNPDDEPRILASHEAKCNARSYLKLSMQQKSSRTVMDDTCTQHHGRVLAAKAADGLTWAVPHPSLFPHGFGECTTALFMIIGVLNR